MDAHAYGIGKHNNNEIQEEENEEWHECDSALTPRLMDEDDDFSDLDQLQILELQGKSQPEGS